MLYDNLLKNLVFVMFQEFQREFSIKEEQQPLKKTSKMITFGFGKIKNETIQISKLYISKSIHNSIIVSIKNVSIVSI